MGAAAVAFDGAAGYASSEDNADWDVFGSTSGDVTVCGWVYFDDAVGSTETLMCQWEDANNRWQLYRSNSGGSLGIYYVSGGTGYIDISGGALAQNTWHHVALVKKGAETGVYIDGAQVAYDATFTADTFAGSLYVGQLGNSSQYFDGRMDDWAIVYHNIFGAAPNSTPNDTFAATLDTRNPLGIVI